MVRWVVDQQDITQKTFITPRKTVIGSFKVENLRKMYHLPPPQKRYHTKFVQKFMQENLNLADLIREWRKEPKKHKREDRGMYSLPSIVGPFSHIAAMLCRLYGYPNMQKLFEEWVPLIKSFVDGYIMDWETILSNNLTTQILNYRQKHNFLERTDPPFFMSAYVMDAICFSYYFPSLGWKWIDQFPSAISIYLDIIWETKYHAHFNKICHELMLLIHREAFGRKSTYTYCRSQ